MMFYKMLLSIFVCLLMVIYIIYVCLLFGKWILFAITRALDIHFLNMYFGGGNIWAASRFTPSQLCFHYWNSRIRTRTKLLDQIPRKGGDEGGDGNGICDGYGRVKNDDEKNIPSGETRDMLDGDPITLARSDGLISRHLMINGGSRGGRRVQ